MEDSDTPNRDALPFSLTVDEAAGTMRVNRKTLYELIAAGEVPGVSHFGRAIRIHRDTFLRWLAEGAAPRSGTKA